MINETHDETTNEWSAEETATDNKGAILPTYRCIAHKDIADIVELYGVLHKNSDGENRVKNLVEKKLIEDLDLGLSEDIEQDGKAIRKFKEGITYNWRFEGTGKDRVLKVSIGGANLQKKVKDDLHAKIAADIGKSEKLVIE